MILIDTSVWIDFLRNTDSSLVDQMTEHLENGTAVGVSAVFGELLQGARTADEEKLILEFWNNVPKVDEHNLFIEAGKLSAHLKLFDKGVGLIDCYLLAAAVQSGFDVWTMDRKLLAAYNRMQI